MDTLSYGLLLGLSTGIFCLGYCAPVLVPLLMSERRTLMGPVAVLGEVAAGRLIAYLTVGAGVGYLGLAVEGKLTHEVSGMAMVGLGILLALFLLPRLPVNLTLCRRARFLGSRYPVLFGLLTGFNVCPPFLAAIAYGTALSDVMRSTVLFAGFFLGTTAFLVPLVPVGWAAKWETIRTVGRMAGALSALFLIMMGAWQLLA